MRFVTFLMNGLRRMPDLLQSSIKYKLFVIFLIMIAIPTLLSGIIFFRMSSAVVQEDFIRNKGKIMENVSNVIDENTNSLSRQSLAIYNNPDDILYVLKTDSTDNYTAYLDAYTRMSNYFQSVLQSNDIIESITLFSTSGDVKYYTNKSGGTTSFDNVRYKAWFLDTIAKNGRPFITVPYYNDYVMDNTIRNTAALSVTRSVLDLKSEDNTAWGVLAFHQPVSQLEQLLRSAISEQNEIVIVSNTLNQTIYTNQQMAPDDYIKLMEQMNTYAATDTRTFRFTTAQQSLLVTFYVSREYGWRVISLLPIAELEKKSLFLKNINITLFLILSVVAFIISITFSHLVTKPLHKLMASFRKFQRGDFETRIDVKGKDELSNIGITFNKMVAEMKQLIEQKYEMTIFRNQAELKALQNQINPHFLYNTLTSIKAVIDKKDHAFASVMVQHLSDIFRYNLSNGQHTVPFRDELAYIRKYLFIQECRYPDKLKIYYDIDEDVLEYGILRLTLQPIVENALYHGLEPKVGEGEVRIVAKLFNEHLYIYVTDNGVGIPEGELADLNERLAQNPEWTDSGERDQIGISNVNARIQYYYGPEYRLKVTSTPNVLTMVKIVIPARREIN